MRTKGKTIVVNEKVDVEFLTMAIDVVLDLANRMFFQ